MDKITASLLAEFQKSQGIESENEATAFEHFANYSILFNELADTFDLEDVHVADEGNIGIDGIAIIINGSLVTSEQEADTLIKANGFLDVDFVFVQAKTSSGFDLGEMSKFFFAIGDFFSEPPKLKHSAAVQDLIRLKSHLYFRSAEMRNRNPNVDMYYVCTGKWNSDNTLIARADSAKKELEDTSLFKTVEFHPVAASKLQELYRSTRGKNEADFNFLNRTSLPNKVQGVKEAHFGLVTATDYIKLITDQNGNIKKSLFYDNVRDFQDLNDVNKGIKATLHSDKANLFLF